MSGRELRAPLSPAALSPLRLAVWFPERARLAAKPRAQGFGNEAMTTDRQQGFALHGLKSSRGLARRVDRSPLIHEERLVNIAALDIKRGDVKHRQRSADDFIVIGMLLM